MKKLASHLTVQVIIAIILGILAGLFFPRLAPTAKVISQTFINMINMLIAPIIFFTLVLGIARMDNMKKVGRVGGKALLYFEIVTTFALAIGMIVANVLKPGKGVSPFVPGASPRGIPAHGMLPPNSLVHDTLAHAATAASAAPAALAHAAAPVTAATSLAPAIAQGAKGFDWLEFVTHIVPHNIFESFSNGDIIQILFFTILFGFGLSKMGPEGAGLIGAFEKISRVLFNMMKFIMKLAPIGAFGGMAFTIGNFGIGVLLPMGKTILAVYTTCILFIFGVLGLICYFNRFSLLKYLRYIREEILIVLGTSSSESALPSMIQKMEKFGCSKSVVGLVIPTGYSFNLDGTSIYLSIALIFLAQVFNVEMTVWQQLTALGILMITSKGAAGVTGSGFIVLSSTLSVLKIMPVENVAILLGVDRFMSEARSITNLIGNGIATVVIAKSEKEFDEAAYREITKTS